ncbi:MAG: LysM peptidoglycan-binding domain-containing protein [Chloroflexi bacterium]|nr:LysM peptidoglycan-binding domain-containing protein [Chloroflexota bacterium]
MHAKHWIAIALIFTLIAIALPGPLQAQNSDNLLTNGDFEGSFEAVRGDVTKTVAEGWEPWNLDVGDPTSSLNREPEYGVAPSNRVHGGSSAQEYNTFFAPHDAGLLQRVDDVTAGTAYTFSVFMYIWSTTDFSNVDESNNPLGVEVQVGIDPNGGNDPESADIVWSTPQEYYDEYREQSVSATAGGTSITAFIRSTVDRDDGVSAIYVDDASLLEGAPQPPATTQAPAPTTEVPPAGTTAAPPATTEAPPVTTEAPPATTVAPPSTTQAPPGTEEPTEPAGPTAVPTPYSAELPNEVVYTVTFGDTVIELAQRFNSTVAAIIDYNDLPSSGLIFINQVIRIPVPAGQGSPVGGPPGGGPGVPSGGSVYIVKPGDNLFRIALNNGLSVDVLARYNNILNPWRIYVGQEIRIPPPGAVVPQPSGPQPSTAVPIPPGSVPPAPSGQGFVVHTVQPGENIFRIGLRYNLTWDVIARANGLFNPNYIFPGQQLIIPQGGYYVPYYNPYQYYGYPPYYR